MNETKLKVALQRFVEDSFKGHTNYLVARIVAQQLFGESSDDATNVDLTKLYLAEEQ